jgi:ribokinase
MEREPAYYGRGAPRSRRTMKTAVVGHVEWVNFLRIDRVLSPGAIALAGESWEEPAGGGGVAAVELARLA